MVLSTFWHNHVAIFADSDHTGLLTDGANFSSRNFIRSSDEIFEIDFVRQVHFCSDSWKNEALLTAIGQRKLNLSIKTARSFKVLKIWSKIGHFGAILCKTALRSAGSSVSWRLVAMITFTFTDWSNPSIWVKISSKIRWTSRSAPVWASKRLVAMASTSSMKMILFQLRNLNFFKLIIRRKFWRSCLGEFSLARRKTSLTILGPSPKYFWTNSEPTTRINEAVVWWATAFLGLNMTVRLYLSI